MQPTAGGKLRAALRSLTGPKYQSLSRYALTKGVERCLRSPLSPLPRCLAAVGTAQACSTLVIGKAVSETGNIIVAHNEDNGGRLFNMQHYVPPAKHKKGEMLKFEKFAAEIPQVEETLGFYWTQTFVPDGASFADGFMNDAGVVVATNWCGEIFDADRMEVKDGGIGYGIRRLVAERAHYRSRRR